MALERDTKERRGFDRSDNAYDEDHSGQDLFTRQLKDLLEDGSPDRPVLSADRSTPQQRQVEDDKLEEKEEVLSAIPVEEISAETLDRTDDDRDSGYRDVTYVIGKDGSVQRHVEALGVQELDDMKRENPGRYSRIIYGDENFSEEDFRQGKVPEDYVITGDDIFRLQIDVDRLEYDRDRGLRDSDFFIRNEDKATYSDRSQEEKDIKLSDDSLFTKLQSFGKDEERDRQQDVPR